MQIAVLYVSPLIVFLAIDLVGISRIIRPLSKRHVGDLQAVPIRLGPVAAFYATYVHGALHFVSPPALTQGRPGMGLIGLMCYATCEFNSCAVLRDWALQQAATDTIRGGFLTGLSA